MTVPQRREAARTGIEKGDRDQRALCDHICLLDDGHVERGEGHFYGYELPSPRESVPRPVAEKLAAALREVANLNHFDGYDHYPLFETCDAPSCNQARAALAEFSAAPSPTEADDGH